ncbi:MAG: hypothetical protein LBP87_15230 [Planctomycetaceae bacterium]|jgi:hypothetical protein|nr:hypothetical protein [Planctomycetaceae bacterium]
MVTTTIDSIESLSDLKCFVYRTLCHDHDLMVNAFPTSETILKRGQLQPCGMMFCLHGPRAVKFSAIWEKDSNRILFYGPTGKRYSQVEVKNIHFSFDELTLSGNKPTML